MNLHHVGELLGLVLTREERVASVELGHDAAEAPHVDGSRVRDAQDDLGRSVEATLDVCVYALILEAAASVIDDLDPRLVRLL